MGHKFLEDAERLRALMDETPWFLRDVLAVLCDAADYLLSTHDCDHEGYEGVMAARDAGQNALKEFLA